MSAAGIGLLVGRVVGPAEDMVSITSHGRPKYLIARATFSCGFRGRMAR